MDIKIERKKVKYARTKINSLGEVTLTIPFNLPIEIEKKLLDKAYKWALKRIDKVRDETLINDIKDDGSIYILGKKYSIKVFSGNDHIELSDNVLYVYSKSYENKKIEKLILKYLDDLRMTVYKSTLDKYLDMTGLSVNKLSIHSLKKSYGRCYTERKEIILSKSIIHKRIEFIEAIVLHEIAHLKYPNHQKNFYNFIYSYMSDYKDRLKMIKY